MIKDGILYFAALVSMMGFWFAVRSTVAKRTCWFLVRIFMFRHWVKNQIRVEILILQITCVTRDKL